MANLNSEARSVPSYGRVATHGQDVTCASLRWSDERGPHGTQNDTFRTQIARNLVDSIDGFLRSHRLLICDRDTKFTEQFGQVSFGRFVSPVNLA